MNGLTYFNKKNIRCRYYQDAFRKNEKFWKMVGTEGKE